MTVAELKKFIESSNLPQEDKDLWSDLDDLPDEFSQKLADFIDENELRLKFLTTNLKMKRQFSREPDPKIIDKMIDTTQEYLTKLTA